MGKGLLNKIHLGGKAKLLSHFLAITGKKAKLSIIRDPALISAGSQLLADKD